MERNYRNYIEWKEPASIPAAEKKIKASPNEKGVNTKEVQAIFDTKISEELVEENARAFENAPVQISSEDTGEKITVYLEVNSSPPYLLRKDGTEIASELSPEDFPYEFDVNSKSGEGRDELASFEDSFEVEIESKIGNTDTQTVSVLFDFNVLVSSSDPISKEGKSGDYWIVNPDQESSVAESANRVYADEQPPPSSSSQIDGSFWLNVKTLDEQEAIDIGKIEDIVFQETSPEDTQGEDQDVILTNLFIS